MPSSDDPENVNTESPAWTLIHAAHALKSRHAEDRLSAIAALKRMDSAEATVLLVDAMKDRLSWVGATAARALVGNPSSDVCQSMVDHFFWASEDGKARDAGCAVRIEIAIALGNAGYDRAVPALRLGVRTMQVEMWGSGLDDLAVGLRANCALGLSQLRPQEALIDLALLLFDAILEDPFPTDSMVARRAAATGLGTLGDPGGSAVLATRLRAFPDEDPQVVTECLSSLAALRDPQAIDIITPYLNDTQSFLAAAAAMALAITQTVRAVDLLREALETQKEDRLPPLAAALATVRLPEARRSLLSLTCHSKRILRKACATALSVYPDREVLDRLRQMAAEDICPQVRAAAAEALGRK